MKALVLAAAILAIAAPADAKRKKREAAAAPVVTLAQVSGWPDRVVAQCDGGVWANIAVDDDNPGGCQYFCVTTEGAGMTIDTLAGCP